MDPSWVILQDRVLDGEPNSRTPDNTEFTKSGAYQRHRNGTSAAEDENPQTPKDWRKRSRSCSPQSHSCLMPIFHVKNSKQSPSIGAYTDISNQTH